MFKYNELSDLLNGTLVTPLSKEDDGSIRCLDSEGNECFYEFDDFDFDKQPEERVASLEEQLDSGKNEELEEKTEEKTDTQQDTSSTTIEEVIEAIEDMETDDSLYDGTDDTEVITTEDDEKEETEEDERFLNSEETNNVLSEFNIEKDSKTNYLIWRDII